MNFSGYKVLNIKGIYIFYGRYLKMFDFIYLFNLEVRIVLYCY